jgi:hypothetical protein
MKNSNDQSRVRRPQTTSLESSLLEMIQHYRLGPSGCGFSASMFAKFYTQSLTNLSGLSLSLFAATVTTISTFKPQLVNINHVFLAVLSHFLGRGLEKLTLRKSRIGRFLNPHPVSDKFLVRDLGFGDTASELVRQSAPSRCPSQYRLASSYR